MRKALKPVSSDRMYLYECNPGVLAGLGADAIIAGATGIGMVYGAMLGIMAVYYYYENC